NLFIAANNLVSTLQIECPRIVREQLRVANDHRTANGEHFFFGYGFEYNFWSDARGIAHGDSDAGTAGKACGRIRHETVHGVRPQPRLSSSRGRRASELSFSYVRNSIF